MVATSATMTVGVNAFKPDSSGSSPAMTSDMFIDDRIGRWPKIAVFLAFAAGFPI
jgi:hypothetical protein